MSSPSRPTSRPPNLLRIIRVLRAHVTLACAHCQVTSRYRCPHTPILRWYSALAFTTHPHLLHPPAYHHRVRPPPSLQIPRDVYDWCMACVHNKDQDISAKNTASDAANVVAHSHTPDEDRPTADKTQTSICPPRLGID
ncbi:hypothetical protein C8R44DRAFT_887231 [Mycena epipterygia]|nr:hypothetical protein C8R44DRAFT_887231 [Mycena epipterygia]